ncbi:hypothetical protein [Paenibacillus wulumuqiensis]|uniref:hypothetical protein n=1 Tax=Paenibacillus wulumuqiensis TaxID=1567107 RepID=UPI0006193B95|nr:hypothetical protein [Paenibacillus wulumuqiensis]
MINEKKLSLAYKKYKKNFSEGITPEYEQKRYLRRENKIKNIIETNDTEKDHILLNSLDSIFDYNMSLWKANILIQEEYNTNSFKNMQMTIFYECIAQEIYETRYPDMHVQYNFKEVITALIHFVMFGWETEEKILLTFIKKNLGKHLLDVNSHYKHSWYLLNLYLQYRNENIMGCNKDIHQVIKEKLLKAGQEVEFIPIDLNIYDEMLANWNTNSVEEISVLISKLSDYHMALASELGNSIEFGDYVYAFYPYEILFLLHVRKKLNLPVPNSFEDFLMNTAEAKMQFEDPEPYPEWDPMLRMIDDFYRKNYSEYIPNQHGPLFEQ